MDRLEFKFAPEGMDAKTGEFAGYGAVFGNVDSHGDVIEQGAFKDSLDQWKARGSLPPMRLMHGTASNPFGGSDLPLGKWKTMREDNRGLYVEGKLSGMDTDRGRYHYALMEDGALSALSIGYKTLKAARGAGEVKRRLQTIGLVEVSLLPEGSNPAARVTDMKSWAEDELPSLKQFEDFLREAGNFSKTQAAAIAGKGLSHLLRGEPGSASEAAVFYAALGALPPT